MGFGLGDLFGGGGDGKSESTATSVPWDKAQPYILDAFKQAQNLYQTGGPQYYPNATYVPFSNQSQMGMDMLMSRGMNGNPMTNAAQNWGLGQLQGGNQWTNRAGLQASLMGTGIDKASNQLRSTAQGDYLNANPYLDLAYNQAAKQLNTQFNEGVTPNINATFGAAGRTGSGAHALATGKAAGELSDSMYRLASDVYGGNYQQERDRQLSAAGGLGAYQNAYTQTLGNMGAQDVSQRLATANLGMGLANQDYTDISAILGVGGMVEGKANQALNDSMDRFSFYQNRPETNLDRYISRLNGNPGAGYGTTTNQQNGGGGGMVGNAMDIFNLIGAGKGVYDMFW